ncbi:MAG: hypothetical protein R2762_25215 [Bryobacteraceae bacterium]
MKEADGCRTLAAGFTLTPRPKSESGQFTAAELDLMEIIWEHGPATVQMVLGRMPPNRSPASRRCRPYWKSSIENAR